MDFADTSGISIKNKKRKEEKKEKNTEKEKIPAENSDCCGSVVCPPLPQERRSPVNSFSICQRMT